MAHKGFKEVIQRVNVKPGERMEYRGIIYIFDYVRR